MPPDALPADARHDGTWAIVAGGGTAGHLVPGLAMAAALVARGHDRDAIHFVGSDRGVEAQMVPAAGFGLDQLPGRGLSRSLSPRNVRSAWGLVRGAGSGVRIVRRHRPAVVVSLGGHAAFACALGAVVTRRPLVLVEQNVRAGAVNRVLRRFAAASAVTFPGTDLPRATVTGNPLRADLALAAARRADPATAVATTTAAREDLDLPHDRVVVAVTTGSLGSQRVNTAVSALAERWGDRDDVAIRHVTGRRDFDRVAANPARSTGGAIVYQLVAYEDRVDQLLAAADVAVTRAGAGTCTELAAFAVPAVMVPLPIATRDHQTANARVLVEVGGATVIPDAELDVDRLEAELAPLVSDAGLRARMASAVATLARPDAAQRVADLVEAVARG